MFRRLHFASVVVVLVALVTTGGGLLWFKHELARPGPHGKAAVVLIPPGSGVKQIARNLSDAGVVRSELMFRLGARFDKLDRALKSGEFALPAQASLRQVMAVLKSGKVVARRLTVPEGLAVAEVLPLVDAAEGLTGPLPPVPDEGSLMPETYQYAYYDTKAGVVHRMESAMTEALAKLWAGRAADLPFDTPRQALILASIVEKETGVAVERPRVAAVFVNRLRKGMKLQSDPTVVYGITQGKRPLGRALTKADLEAPTPYNTYVIDGLPPGPIANPGRAAIEAVLHPAQSDDLYFVADGSGGHAFSDSLSGHNRNVAKWRKIEHERKNGAGGK